MRPGEFFIWAVTAGGAIIVIGLALSMAVGMVNGARRLDRKDRELDRLERNANRDS